MARNKKMPDLPPVHPPLLAMVEKAEAEGLWFFSTATRKKWYAPQAIRDYNSQGWMCMPAVNFELRSPPEHFKNFEVKRRRAYLEEFGEVDKPE